MMTPNIDALAGHRSEASSRSRIVRNLVIFSLAAVGAGWLGLVLDRALHQASGQGPGMLVWLVLPALTGLGLRTWGGDGWQDAGFKPAFRGNGSGYLLALVLFPACLAILLGIGFATGWITPGVNGGIQRIFSVVAVALLPNFVKNLFEEFAWRGYLTPRLNALGVPAMKGYALVAVVWFTWHLPYFLFFLDRSLLQRYTSLEVVPFLLLGFIGMLPASVVYGELRLATGSVWPLVLLHTIQNALVPGIVLEGIIRVAPQGSAWVAPGGESLGMALLFTGVGSLLLRRPTRADFAKERA